MIRDMARDMVGFAALLVFIASLTVWSDVLVATA